MAAIKKKVDIEVNSSALEKALKNLSGMNKTVKDIFKANQSLLELFSKQQKIQNESIRKEKEKLEVLKKQEASAIKLANIRKLYETSKARKDLELQIEKRELETPRQTLLERYQRYKGFSGAFRVMGENVEKEGQIKENEFNRAILEQSQQRSKMVEAAEKEKDPFKKRAAYIDISKKDEEIARLEKEKSKSIGDTKTQAAKYAAMAQAAQKVDAAFKKLGNAVLGLILKPLNNLKNAIAESVSAMLSFRSGVATFSTGTSLITNTAAREQQLKYGLSASQNYAFTRAKEMLNIQSDEDLMYMNKDQRDRLLSYMEGYSKWYEDLEQSGVLANIQEMQLEFAELKEEIAMDFLSWVAENKETIMICIKGMFEFLKTVSKVVLDIINFLTSVFGGKKGEEYGFSEVSRASDTVNNNQNNSKNTNITINANTTNNATGVLGSQEALDQFNKENWAQLAKDVVGAIGG